jgi:hypothetical protein
MRFAMTAEIIRFPCHREPPDGAAPAAGPVALAVLPLPAARAPVVAWPCRPGADNPVEATAALLAACHDLVAQLDRIGRRSEALHDRMAALELGAEEVAVGGQTIVAALRGLAVGAAGKGDGPHG